MAQIPLQTAFLRFTIRYVGYPYGLSTSLFKDYLDAKNKESALDDNAHFDGLLLSAQELFDLEEKRKRNARLLRSPDQFAIMLCETPISIFFKSSQGHEGFFPSSKVFSRDKDMHLLMNNQFSSMSGKDLYVDELEFDKACHHFFHVTGDLPPDHKSFIVESCQEGRFLASLELFNNDAKGAFEIIKKYSKEEDYEEDGVVSVFLQNNYRITATEANRNFLRMLKSVRSYLPSNEDTAR